MIQRCKVCNKSGYRPYSIAHKPGCIQAVIEAAFAETAGADPEWGGVDYEIEPGWYWAQSISGAGRGH